MMTWKAVAFCVFQISVGSLLADTYVNRVITHHSDDTLSTNWQECVIATNVTWRATDGPFVVDNYDLGITVATNGNLTIEPGTTLIFTASRDWSGLQVFGRLMAVGTAQQPIVFRRDPAQTNGAWSGLRFGSNCVATIQNAVVQDAGHLTVGWQVWHPNAALYISSSSPAIGSVTVSNSQGHGFLIVGDSSPTITACTTYNSAGNSIQWNDLFGTPVFRGNAGFQDHVSGIFIANGTLTNDWTMFANPMPYVLAGYDGPLAVGAQATLTIEPGIHIKVMPCRDDGSITVNGGLACGASGAAPVVITSFYDASVDGNTALVTNLPARGDWSGIRFPADAAGTKLRYAGHIQVGWQSWHPGAALYVNGSGPLIYGCRVTDAQGSALSISGTSSAVVTNNEMSSCGGYTIN